MSGLSSELNKNKCLKILREAQAGNTDVIKRFHDQYPQVHWSQLRYERTGDSVLHAVARLGHVEVIQYLLNNYKPNSVDCKNNDNKTALHEAAQFARYDAAAFLIEKGADVNALKKADWTPLMLACTKISGDNSLKLVEMLLKNRAVVNFQNKDGWTALHLIAREGDRNVFGLLVKYGLDVNIKTKNGRSALHIAALHGNYTVAEDLVEHGLDVDKPDSCGNSPLHEAILGGDLQICGLLLNKGCNVNARNKSDFSVIHLAASEGHTHVITYVIEVLRCDVNATMYMGLTPLHCAARNQRHEAYQLLVAYGANKQMRDKYGRIPADYIKIW